MKILVTGAAGFIGSHVCEYFINLGHSVVGLDNFDPFYSRKIKLSNISGVSKNEKFCFYEADIRNSSIINKVFSSSGIDTVVHLAAKAGVRPSIDSVAEYYDVNVQGTLTLLEAMKTNKVRRLIFASSSSVYGNNQKVPFSESDPVDNPISPYASSKKSGELLCHVYNFLYGFDVTCLRFFTVFGPRQRPDLAIHKFTKLIDDGNQIPLYGDGSTARDYTYIDDIINGISCAFNNLGGYRIYNLGESRLINLSDLVSTIESILGKKALINRLPLQSGDVKVTYADISKAQNEIGYNPKFNFREGMQKFIKWYLNNQSENKP